MKSAFLCIFLNNKTYNHRHACQKASLITMWYLASLRTFLMFSYEMTDYYFGRIPYEKWFVCFCFFCELAFVTWLLSLTKKLRRQTWFCPGILSVFPSTVPKRCIQGLCLSCVFHIGHTSRSSPHALYSCLH
jgi:hypothetical protein